MRLVHLFCIFLTIAVCSIARNDAAPTNEGNVPVYSQTHITTESGKAVTSGSPTAVSSHASIDTSNITTPIVNTTTTIPDVKTSNATKINTSEITTSVPTIATKPTTTTTTTKIPSTTSNKPTEKPIISTTSSTTSNQTTVSPTSVTTAIPISTKEAPPHKERQFDGLSFIGGIILIICLMAIGIFSYKFYNTLNERNYRTL